jgi:hypothetical protein
MLSARRKARGSRPRLRLPAWMIRIGFRGRTSGMLAAVVSASIPFKATTILSDLSAARVARRYFVDGATTTTRSAARRHAFSRRPFMASESRLRVVASRSGLSFHGSLYSMIHGMPVIRLIIRPATNTEKGGAVVYSTSAPRRISRIAARTAGAMKPASWSGLFTRDVAQRFQAG